MNSTVAARHRHKHSASVRQIGWLLPCDASTNITTLSESTVVVCCRAFVGRSFVKSVDEAKYAFFSDDLPEADAIK
jgi:hypothetical protein